MDGEEAHASRFDGRAVAVDPGMHEFALRSTVGTVIDDEWSSCRECAIDSFL